MLSQLKAVQWASFAQPDWNQPHSVPKALSKVMAAADVESCSSANDALLYSVGNNHAGTYYPVLLAVMPFLEEILRSGSHWPQRTVLCVLDDLFASFHPESGYENASPPEGGAQDVEAAFRKSVHALSDTLEHIAAGENPNSRLAEELLSLLSEDVA